MEALCSSETYSSTYHTILYQKPEYYTPTLFLFQDHILNFQGRTGRNSEKSIQFHFINYRSIYVWYVFSMRDTVNMKLSCLHRRNVTDSLQVGPAFSDTIIVLSGIDILSFMKNKLTSALLHNLSSRVSLICTSNSSLCFTSCALYCRRTKFTHFVYAIQILLLLRVTTHFLYIGLLLKFCILLLLCFTLY
jgi:hypothetical protein